MDHRPVLLSEVVREIPPSARRIVDATLGMGGHAKAMLEAAPRATFLGIDQDEEMVRHAQRELTAFSDRVNIVLANFRDIDWAASQIGWDWVDVVLFDLGVASPQLLDPARGLTFQADGPLDMRLDQSQALTAAEVINTWPERELVRMLRELGEEPFAVRIARRIVTERRKHQLKTTGELVKIIEASVPAKERYRRRVHVATNTFRAVRMVVNDELASLSEAIPKAVQLLAPGGTILIISFHSLEDRLVKTLFRDDPRLQIVTKKPITASAEEVNENPRARSAKLRIAIKKQTI